MVPLLSKDAPKMFHKWLEASRDSIGCNLKKACKTASTIVFIRLHCND